MSMETSGFRCFTQMGCPNEMSTVTRGGTQFATWTGGLYLFLLPWDGYFLLELGFPFSPSFVPLLGLFLLLGHLLLANRFSLRFPKPLLALATIILYGFAALTWTLDIPRSLLSLGTLASYLATLIVLYNCMIVFHCDVRRVLHSYIAGVATVGLAAFAYVPWQGRFAIASGFNPTWYAAFLAFGIIGCVATLNHQSRSHFITGGLCIGFFVVLLLMTQGQNAILALILSFAGAVPAYVFSVRIPKRSVALLMRKPRRCRQLFVTLCCVGAITAIAVTETDMGGTLGRLERTIALAEGPVDMQTLDMATAGRLSIWSDYVRALGSEDSFGTGIGNAAGFLDARIGRSSSPHNVYILLFVELGLFGLALWVVFHTMLLRQSLRLKRRSFALLWLSLFYFVFGFNNDVLHYKYYWIGLMLHFLLLLEVQRRPHASQS